MADNPFLDYLEDSQSGRRSLFFGGYQNIFGDLPTSQRKKQALENVFQDVQNEFLAELGSQALSGEQPSLRFTEFLGQTPDPTTGNRRSAIPFTDRIYRQMGNPYTRNLVPRTRFLTGY
tara:strand:- start:507 stop:863 length:357 start_codon:yes stop_codon:yes gene_type:complete